MKKTFTLFSALTILISANAFADNASCANVSCAPPESNSIKPIISQYSIDSKTQANGYIFEAGEPSPGSSWGGNILISPNNQFVKTALCCQDADQFFVVTNHKGQSCYIASDVNPYGKDFTNLVRFPTGGADCSLSPTTIPGNYVVAVSVIK